MEKQNTPMQDAIIELKDFKSIQDSDKSFLKGLDLGINISITLLESLLPKERDVIVKPYSEGQDNYREFVHDRLNNRLTYDEQYFAKTFKTQDDE